MTQTTNVKLPEYNGDMFDRDNVSSVIKDDVLKMTQTTNVKLPEYTGDMFDRDSITSFIKDKMNINNVNSNFSILVYNPHTKNYSEINGSVKDKQNIAVQSSVSQQISLTRDDGTQIKIKDYTSKVVNSNAGNSQLVLILKDNYDLQLDRNLPLHAIGSGYVSYNKDNRSESQPITSNRVKTSAKSAVTISTGVEDVSRKFNYDINLHRQSNFGNFSNAGSSFGERANVEPTLIRNYTKTYNNDADRFVNAS